LIDEACKCLFSKAASEWINLNEAIQIFRKYGLTEDEAETILRFLAKYFLEFDECEGKVRPLESFRKLYKRE